MTALCEFFPGGDIPINYNDFEDDDSLSNDDEYMYDTRDDDDVYTDSEMSHTVYPHPEESIIESTSSTPQVQLRNTNPANLSPRRPLSFVEMRVNELKNLTAAECQPKTNALPKDEVDVFNRIGHVNIPQQFQNIDMSCGDNKFGRSAITINRTSSSPVPSDRMYIQPSEGSTPQDSLRNLRSPVVFSESSSPRRLSPIAYPNVGNINPRHADIEYWNKENEKLSPTRTSPSINSNTNSAMTDSKEDYNQNYFNGTNNVNAHIESLKNYNFNGNVLQNFPYGHFETPLQIEVDPVSI